ncbi:MAG: hypothetical protein AB1666_00110 [Pseudomonadota bacterium]|uniref:Uncharacterized protein n=1 Tax=Caldimonas aquatica TaxID=376175 RepID=A0ABY6MW72_9BURK|nr:hypothetical protein [Schlegelella aquatica]UZD56252.1 hypothetical protein OMP39_06690 [Schlegelella aquatica]
MWKTAAERIAFSEAVDFLLQGQVELVGPERIDDYVRQGLLRREGDQVTLTADGEREYRAARNERFSDG